MKTIVTAKKPKKTQYIVGSVVAFLILFMWVSLPLMNKTGSSSSPIYGGSFSKKSADLSLLADGAGADAPGAPLSGELIDNPATALDMAASSLFSSGDSSETVQDESAAGAANSTADGNVPVPDANPGSNYGSVPKGKLSVLPSLTAGNSNTNTVGGTHNKFFGQENAKADFKPSDLSDIKPKSEKGQALLASLKNAQEQSVKAANSPNLNDARNSASQAFGASVKADDSKLVTEAEQKFAEAGTQLGKVDTSMKKNDPSLTKKEIKLPEPKEMEVDNSDEEMKKMLMQMIIQATVGAVFSGIGGAISGAITGSLGGKKGNSGK